MNKSGIKGLLIILALGLFTFVLSSEEILFREDGTSVILYDDHTWAENISSQLTTQQIVDKNRQFLRSGYSASEFEIAIACEMYEQGWRYTMPRPKSSKAAWGVSDGRTTWWYGWWYNSVTGQYSDRTPTKSGSGMYVGDGQNNANQWRNGGSPARPDVFMYLLSGFGGPG